MVLKIKRWKVGLYFEENSQKWVPFHSKQTLRNGKAQYSSKINERINYFNLAWNQSYNVQTSQPNFNQIWLLVTLGILWLLTVIASVDWKFETFFLHFCRELAFISGLSGLPLVVQHWVLVLWKISLYRHVFWYITGKLNGKTIENQEESWSLFWEKFSEMDTFHSKQTHRNGKAQYSSKINERINYLNLAWNQSYIVVVSTRRLTCSRSDNSSMNSVIRTLWTHSGRWILE